MTIKNITINIPVKIIFKERDQRFPMIGKFVNLSDAASLASKGMVRFVNQSVWDSYSGQVALTKIYVVTDFSQVIPMIIPSKIN